MTISKVAEGLPEANEPWSIPTCALCGKSLWRVREVKVVPGPPTTVMDSEMETWVTVVDGDFHDSCPDCESVPFPPEPDVVVG